MFSGILVVWIIDISQFAFLFPMPLNTTVMNVICPYFWNSLQIGFINWNLATFCQDKPLNHKEIKALLRIADKMLGKKVLTCTAYWYCTTHCPKGLDIPSLLSLYNEHCFTNGGFIAPMAMMALPEEKHPGGCVAGYVR